MEGRHPEDMARSRRPHAQIVRSWKKPRAPVLDSKPHVGSSIGLSHQIYPTQLKRFHASLSSDVA